MTVVRDPIHCSV